jgi:2'-5' RNA ligase
VSGRPAPEEARAHPKWPKPGGDTLRLFVAVELPDEVRRALGATIDAMKAAGVDAGLRFVRPEGVHITLKFLGSTPSTQVPAIEAGLRDAVAATSAIDLHPGGIGTFHGRRHEPHLFRGRESYPSNIRVIWLHVGGDVAALQALAASVEAQLQPLGFPGEQRAFYPHLTLARMSDDSTREDRERVYHALRALEPSAVPSFRADRVSLMQSTLAPGGAVYRALATLPLQ